MLIEGVIKYRTDIDSKVSLERNTATDSYNFYYDKSLPLHEFINQTEKLIQELKVEFIKPSATLPEVVPPPPTLSSNVERTIPVEPAISNFMDKKFDELLSTSKAEDLIQVETPVGVRVVPKAMLANQVKRVGKVQNTTSVETELVQEVNSIDGVVAKPIVSPNSLKSTGRRVK